MSENFGTKYHAPSSGLIHAYKVWAEGNPGLLITGNVMVDSKALGEARNVVVEDAVLDGENSLVIEQANNRTYAAQIVLKNILKTL